MLVRGVMTADTGLPAAAASRDFRVDLYAAASGGSSLWTSAVMTHTVAANGAFVLKLDAGTTLARALSLTSTPWFEVTVDAGTANGVMDTPRRVAGRIRPSGATFALGATSTDGLSGYPAASPTPSSGQLLGWSASAWTPTNAPGVQSGLNVEAFRRTTTALNLYVRTDGSDSTCNGLTNASSASAPACSFATPQKAMDVIPDVVLHPVTVNVQAGTYRGATANVTYLTIGKLVKPTAGLVVRGVGSVIFSGATSGAPTTAVGKWGVEVRPPSNVTLSNLTLSYFTSGGIQALAASQYTLSGVTVSNTSGIGLAAGVRSSGTLTDANAFIKNGAHGILVGSGHLQTSAGTLVSVSNSIYGMVASTQGLIELVGGTVNVSYNGSYGIAAHQHSSVVGSANVTTNSNQASGLRTYASSNLVFSGTTTVNSNAWIGLDNGNLGVMQMDGNVTANSSGWTTAYTVQHGQLIFNKGLTSTMSTAAWLDHVMAQINGAMYFNNEGSDAISLTGTSSIHRGIGARQSLVVKSGSGSVTLSTYLYQGIWSMSHGVFMDIGTGTRSVSGISYSDTAYVEQMSLYRRGNFAAGNCAAGTLSRCN